MITLCVNAAAGRMGRRILALAIEAQDITVTQALEHPEHESLGRDIGILAGTTPQGLVVTDTMEPDTDVAIDFSTPEATMKLLEQCTINKTAIVIGTTGLDKSQIAAVQNAGKVIPVLLSPNMSVGVNVIFRLAEIAAQALNADYDVEVIEAHHRFKKDSPSGTALRLVERIAHARNVSPEDVMKHGRQGTNLERTQEEIGVHSLRIGDVVGDHTVVFGNLGECVEIRHKAHTRDIFVRGALHAAKFLSTAKPGFYKMSDILGI